MLGGAVVSPTISTQTVSADDLKKLLESTKNYIESDEGKKDLKQAADESKRQTEELRAARQIDAYRLKRRIVI